MSEIVTVTKAGRRLDASPGALPGMLREGWKIVEDAAPEPARQPAVKARIKRKARK